MKTIFIGMDEAGRGSWAGPLVVSGICTENVQVFHKILDLNDSKKLSPKKRENIFKELLKLEKEKKIIIATEIINASVIDEIGIREANRRAMENIIFQLCEGKYYFHILIDGADNFRFEKLEKQKECNYVFAQKKSLKGKKSGKEVGIFCENGQNIKIHFIIGGDATESIISAASIIAKVTRDSLMIGYSMDFPEYEFEKHKGYGTKKHYEAIINYGINFLHRKSYEPIKTLISGNEGL